MTQHDDEPTPCPICHEPGGFHTSVQHQTRTVPAELTWGPGEPPPWTREKSTEPAHVKEDAAAVLDIIKEHA